MDVIVDGFAGSTAARTDRRLHSRFGKPGQIEFELPGVKKSDIKLKTEKSGQAVIVRVEAKRGDKTYHGMHVVNAAEIDPKGIKSKYENGLLTVTIPKSKKNTYYDREIEIE
jgi:HSP20 family molecular chaperone IbpA